MRKKQKSRTARLSKEERRDYDIAIARLTEGRPSIPLKTVLRKLQRSSDRG